MLAVRLSRWAHVLYQPPVISRAICILMVYTYTTDQFTMIEQSHGDLSALNNLREDAYCPFVDGYDGIHTCVIEV